MDKIDLEKYALYVSLKIDDYSKLEISYDFGAEPLGYVNLIEVKELFSEGELKQLNNGFYLELDYLLKLELEKLYPELFI